MVKTALKLLLVFVEYSESNAPLLIQAITAVDTKRGTNNRKQTHLLLISVTGSPDPFVCLNVDAIDFSRLKLD